MLFLRFPRLRWCLLWLLLCPVFPAWAQLGVTLDSFQGIRYRQYPELNKIPPDISGAVGEQGILQVVNGAVAYFPKTGGITREPLWHLPWSGAAAAFPSSNSCFDPRAFYDAAEKRFFFIILDINNATQKSWLHIAVSRNAHPRGMVDPADATKRVFDPGEWFRYRYDMTRTTGDYSPGDAGGADYPTLCVDGVSMLVTANYFDIAEAGANKKFETGLDEAGIFAFDKASLIAGTGAVANGSAPPSLAPRTWFPDNTDGSIQPAVRYYPISSPSNASFTSLDQDALDTFIDSYYVGYSGPNLVTDDDQTDVDNCIIPSPAPQPGGALPLDQLGDRMLGAVRSNNTIIGVFVCEAPDQSRSVIKVAYLLPGPGATTLQRLLTLDAGPGLWNTMPAIALNAAGCLCVTWTASSASSNPAIYVATTGRSQDFLAPPRRLLTSTSPYFGTGRPGDSFARWGDYAHASVDPVDQSFWICQQYAYDGSENGWGTYWFNVTPGPMPIIVQQPYVTTSLDATPQRGTLLPQGELGEPVRTIKVPQGQQIILNTQVTDSVGQPYQVGGIELEWFRNGELITGSLNQASLPLGVVGLPQQARYHCRLRSATGVFLFSEAIFLDVVLPPLATINQPRLFLGPNATGYFEVTPDAATLPEMDVVSYTWNRPATFSSPILGGRVQAFWLRNPDSAAQHDGVHTCTMANLFGSITVSGTLIAGPHLLTQPTAPSGAPVCGPPLVLTISGTGVDGSGAPGSPRPDFGPDYSGYLWSNDYREGWHNVVWRKDGVPITLGGRISRIGNSFDTTQSLSIADPDYEDEGVYDCVVTDQWGAPRAATSAPTKLLLAPLVPPYLTTDLSHGPDHRMGGNMVFDSRRGRMVLFGGEAYGINPRLTSTTPSRYFSNDTWEWDGQVWVKRNPATRPPALTEFSMTYDSDRGRVVIFGGYEYAPPNFNAGVYQLSNKIWEWDGVDWIQKISTTPSPTARSNAAMAYDSERRETLMIGGNNFVPLPPATADYYAMINALWAWDGVKWMTRPSLPYPAAQASSGPLSPNALAFDAQRKVTVMFGPFFDSTNPVWEWNGTSWNSILPPLPFRIAESRNARAFYDPIRRFVGIPMSANSFANPTSADAGKAALAYWDGMQFIRGELLSINDINGLLPTYGLGSPFSTSGDLSAYDTNRRCLVWLDTIDQFYNSGPSYKTRELHFSGKVKVIRQPTTVNFSDNGNLTFSVIAAGLRPMTFQWLKNGQPLQNTASISGVNTATLTITGASAADAGSYTLRMVNVGGIADSAPIVIAPSGDGLTHSVTGDNLTLTWSGTRVLETSASLTGNWTVLPAASSPYTTPMDENHRFFRLR